MTAQKSDAPPDDLAELDPAAKLAHDRLMWTGRINGHGQFWEALSESDRDGWREYVRDIVAALPVATDRGIDRPLPEDALNPVDAGPGPDWDCGGIPLRARDRWIAAVLRFLRDAGYTILAPGGQDGTRG